MQHGKIIQAIEKYFDKLNLPSSFKQFFLNGEVLCSINGNLYQITEQQKNTINILEEKPNRKVWHVIHLTAYDGDNNKLEINCYLFYDAGNEQFEEFPMNDEDVYMVSSYSQCLNIPIYSEFVPALIKSKGNGLTRIYGEENE